jgi:hypothetical protein
MAVGRFVKLAAIGTAIAGFALFWRRRTHVEDEERLAPPPPADAPE